MRRLVTFVTGLALAAGLIVTGAASAQAASAPNLRLTLNHSLFVAGQSAVVRVHLGGPGAGQHFDLFRTLPGHAATFLGSFQTNSSSDWSDTLGMVFNATYTATYSGSSDGKWYPATTTTGLVRVAPIMSAHLSGSYSTSHGYRLIHNGKKGDLSAAVAPDKHGEKIYFPLQAYSHGKWHTVVDHAYTMKSETVDGVTVSGTAVSFSCTKGTPCRIRAEYHGDSLNVGRTGSWAYVKFA